ncbi:MAG: N-acetylglucosamine kinase [Proteobacteria bacterium]|nr:N-acetylglucosamine kinase [Pseudomonadota bacterium]
MNGSVLKEPLFLGIDGGGSGCRVRLCNGAGDVLGQGQAGPANTLLGLGAVFAEITTATHQALAQAGLPGSGSELIGQLHAGAGLAGLSLAREQKKLAAFAHPFATFRAETDAYAACLGAHDGADGGVVIAGTGSCGLAMVAGRIYTVSGWGFAISDQGSGGALGRAALRQALSEHDGILPASPLGRRIMAHFQNRPEAMFLWSESATPGDYATFAPWVFDTAGDGDAGDAGARTLVRQTAAEIAQLIAALGAKGAPGIALTGGLAGPIRPWLPEYALRLLTVAKHDPLHGALMLARSGAGA